MKKYFWLAIIFVLLLTGWFIYSISQPKAIQKPVKTPTTKSLPKEIQVTLSKNGYTPNEVVINTGDAVRWKNISGADQTVNSDDYPANQKYKELNFGEFSSGSSFVYIFKKPGTYTYHNQFHPNQNGKITVK